MPIYEYELVEGKCGICPGRFELRRPISRPALTRCPRCRKAVRKLISAAAPLTHTEAAGIIEAKNAGFTVLERRDRDTFERL